MVTEDADDVGIKLVLDGDEQDEVAIAPVLADVIADVVASEAGMLAGMSPEFLAAWCKPRSSMKTSTCPTTVPVLSPGAFRDTPSSRSSGPTETRTGAA